MQSTKSFSHHFLWLSALFVLGQSIIILPTSQANRLTFLGFLISAFLSFLLTLAVLKLDFLKYPVLLIAIFTIGDTLITFIEFISKTLINEKNFFILILFLIPLLYFCTRKSQELLNFSLISGIACAALIVFFFLSTFKDFSFKNIYIYEFPKLTDLLSQSLSYIKSVTLPITVLALFAKQINTKDEAVFSGVAIGNALLLLTIFNSILLFGTTLAGEFNYPYADAISTVTFGKLFSRLDGFAYFIYFTASLIKITVCVFTIKYELKKAAR